MTYRLKNHSLLLAALLQLLPFVKTVLTHPAAASTWAIVFRWAVGSTAAVGAFDSVSGATSVFTTPSAFSGTVGTPFNASVNVSIGGGNTAASSDYIVLSSGTITSPLLGSGQSTSVTLPPGLTFTASWVNGSVNIGGSISGTPTAAGTYPTTVLIVSPGNAALSQNITITITGSSGPVAPGITAPPVGTNVIAGHNAVFKVTATGTAPLNYAWSKNNSPLADGGNISGSATATLTVASVSAADAGNYTVTVTNTAGKATSTSAALGVIIPPSLTTPPQAVAATAGGNASFSVVATGSAPLNYFWLKNGSALASSAKISGVNTATLGLTGIATTDAGNYSVIVSNTAGSVTSSPAALTIVTSPTISVQPIGRTVATGANVSFAIAAAGSTPLFYFWQKNGQPLADGGNISGSSTTNLNLSAATVNDAGTYSVIVSNALGSATSSNAALAVLIPAGIVTAPVAATVNVGGSTTFTVLASGSTPLNYQWSKNNVNLSGANHATLSLANISANDAGNYSVTVSNAVGGAASSAASLTVLSPPTILSQPVNTTVSLGANAAFTANVTGTAPLHLQWFKNSQPLADGGNISGSSTTNLNLAAVTSSDAGNYSLTIVNAAGSTNSSASSLTVIVPPAIVTPPAPVTAVAGTNISFTVAANGTAPFTFQWQKNGVNLSAANTDTLSLANIGLGNAGNYSVVVGNAAGSITSAVATLTVLLPPAITTQPANQDGPPGNSVTLTVVATGSAPLTYQWFKGSNALADGGNISGANTSALTISSLSTNDVDIYFVVVSNFLGLATSAGASVTVSSAPFILVQPASQIATRSNTVALNVTATGSGTLFYQWRKNGTALANSGGVSGVNTFTLTLANATTNLNGNYSVSITNTFGSVTSSIATLAVYAPPQIVASPTNRTAIVGSNVVFAATVTGTAPLNFQWFKDGIALADGGNISGATTNVLKISNLTPNDEASYSLAVTNPVGNTTSASAALTVLVPPTIITQPVAQSVVASNAVTFSVEANGTAPLRFQWRKAGAAIAGATNANLIIASAKTNDAANYSVIVTNLAGSVTSSNAALTVFTMPVFTLQATNRGAKLASTTIFRAAVSGTLPMNYQWFKNGSALADGGNISGSASNVLTVANVTTNDAGAYSLTATNLAGTTPQSTETTPPSQSE